MLVPESVTVPAVERARGLDPAAEITPASDSVPAPVCKMYWPAPLPAASTSGAEIRFVPVELALVIGALTRNVSPEDALQYVWGFTVANDVTARDLQASDDQWARSKSFDSFCPIGPWLETEFIPEDQMIESRINGEVVQSSTIDQMIFTVPQIISYISHNMTLLPGDVIITGTPAGITKINPGDIIECEVEGVGTLLNQVV